MKLHWRFLRWGECECLHSFSIGETNTLGSPPLCCIQRSALCVLLSVFDWNMHWCHETEWSSSCFIGKSTQKRYAPNRSRRYQEEVARNCIRTLQKDLHVPDNHDGVITDLEPDILECEVKWALESIITYKASGGDGIPVELFLMLKDDAVKVLHSICQKIWTSQQWPQDWKRSVFILIPKKGNAKECSNYCTIHSSHMLVK